MSQKESEIAHAANMENWPPILEKEAYDVVPLISIGGLGILLFSISLSFNFYYGHELPRVMFVLGTLFFVEQDFSHGILYAYTYD